MRYKVIRPFKNRSVVSSIVETAVAMVTTVFVTVFFLALVVFPEAVYAHTARDTAFVDPSTNSTALAV